MVGFIGLALLSAQTAGTQMPLVYTHENTGAAVATPPLPSSAELPSVTSLPDPFTMADGSRMTTRDQWRVRRAEIMAMIEKYGGGEKPGKPSTFASEFSDGTTRITVGEGGNTFTMTAAIARPTGAPEGPLPAIIGVNSPTGALPRALFEERGIATITYRAGEVAPTAFGNITYASGNLARLYPETTAGSMVRWASGVSRIIDALEQHPEAGIDTSRLAVSGCFAPRGSPGARRR